MNYDRIKVYKNTLGDSNFYKTMGKYFAEKEYTDQLPYISNKEGDIWFVAFTANNRVMGFMAIKQVNDKINLKHVFVEEQYRNDGLCKDIHNFVFNYINNNCEYESLEVTTNNQTLYKLYLKLGFKVYRETKNYYFMRKEVINNES